METEGTGFKVPVWCMDCIHCVRFDVENDNPDKLRGALVDGLYFEDGPNMYCDHRTLDVAFPPRRISPDHLKCDGFEYDPRQHGKSFEQRTGKIAYFKANVPKEDSEHDLALDQRLWIAYYEALCDPRRCEKAQELLHGKDARGLMEFLGVEGEPKVVRLARPWPPAYSENEKTTGPMARCIDCVHCARYLVKNGRLGKLKGALVDGLYFEDGPNMYCDHRTLDVAFPPRRIAPDSCECDDFEYDPRQHGLSFEERTDDITFYMANLPQGDVDHDMALEKVLAIEYHEAVDDPKRREKAQELLHGKNARGLMEFLRIEDEPRVIPLDMAGNQKRVKCLDCKRVAMCVDVINENPGKFEGAEIGGEFFKDGFNLYCPRMPIDTGLPIGSTVYECEHFELDPMHSGLSLDERLGCGDIEIFKYRANLLKGVPMSKQASWENLPEEEP